MTELIQFTKMFEPQTKVEWNKEREKRKIIPFVIKNKTMRTKKRE